MSPTHRFLGRPRRLALPLLAALALAGCAATPEFAELNTRVLPPQGLSLDDRAELRVALSDADGAWPRPGSKRTAAAPGRRCFAMTAEPSPRPKRHGSAPSFVRRGV